MAAKQTTPEVPAEQAIGVEAEAMFDPVRESAQKAAMTDWQVRQNPAEWTRLANGAAVRIQPGVMPSYIEGSPEADMMSKPVQMISPEYRKPDYVGRDGRLVGHRYQWRVFKTIDAKDMRPQLTSNLHRSGRIRYVETYEIDKQCPFAVYTEHTTGENKYVSHMSMILCEVMDPRLAYDTFKRHEDIALQRAMSASRDIPNSPSLGDGLTTASPGKFGINLSVGETRTGG